MGGTDLPGTRAHGLSCPRYNIIDETSGAEIPGSNPAFPPDPDASHDHCVIK